jgi:hypothetical protein
MTASNVRPEPMGTATAHVPPPDPTHVIAKPGTRRTCHKPVVRAESLGCAELRGVRGHRVPSSLLTLTVNVSHNVLLNLHHEAIIVNLYD